MKCNSDCKREILSVQDLQVDIQQPVQPVYLKRLRRSIQWQKKKKGNKFSFFKRITFYLKAETDNIG